MKTPPTPPKPSSSTACRQPRLPLIYEGSTPLSDEIVVLRQNETVWYFVQGAPVFSHASRDTASFRMLTSSLCKNGVCKLVDVEWTPERLKAAQKLLDKGLSFRRIGERLDIKRDTVYRAFKTGPLRRGSPKAEIPEAAEGATLQVPSALDSAGKRSADDHAAATEMGTACHDILGRTAAMLGMGGPAQTKFEPAFAAVRFYDLGQSPVSGAGAKSAAGRMGPDHGP